MARIQWNQLRNRTYETGVDRGVIYLQSGTAVPWVGLKSVDRITTGLNVNSEYFEGRKFKTSVESAEFHAKVEAISIPSEFYACSGFKRLSYGLYAGSQPRETFGFSYRTLVGDTIVGTDYGYKIHVIYNALAIPDGSVARTNSTVVEPVTYSWLLKTIPYYKRDFAFFKSNELEELSHQTTMYAPVSHLSVYSRTVNPQSLSLLEDVLYGTENTAPELPSPIELIEMVR